MKTLFILFCALLLLTSCQKESLFDPNDSVVPDVDNFDELEKATQKGISLLFFYNSWDKNSFDLLPKVEAISMKEDFESVYFAKINFDKSSNLNYYYVVRGFPVIILLKNGTEVSRFEGKNHSQDKIEKRLNELL